MLMPPLIGKGWPKVPKSMFLIMAIFTLRFTWASESLALPLLCSSCFVEGWLILEFANVSAQLAVEQPSLSEWQNSQGTPQTAGFNLHHASIHPIIPLPNSSHGNFPRFPRCWRSCCCCWPHRWWPSWPWRHRAGAPAEPQWRRRDEGRRGRRRFDRDWNGRSRRGWKNWRMSCWSLLAFLHIYVFQWFWVIV